MAPFLASSASSTMRFASSMSSSLPVSFHQPRDDVRVDGQAVVDQTLDGVGDLELAAGGGLDALTASKMVASNM